MHHACGAAALFKRFDCTICAAYGHRCGRRIHSDYDDTVSTIYKYAINNYVTGYAGYIKLDHNLITTGDGRLSNYIRCAAHLAKGCFFMVKIRGSDVSV